MAEEANEPTLFEKIIAGDIPAECVYQDDQVFAFNDISPQAPVQVAHCLGWPTLVVLRVFSCDTERYTDRRIGFHVLRAWPWTIPHNATKQMGVTSQPNDSDAKRLPARCAAPSVKIQGSRMVGTCLCPTKSAFSLRPNRFFVVNQ